MCSTLFYFYYYFIVLMQLHGLEVEVKVEDEKKVNTIAIYRIRFDIMFADIFIISAFMWFPLELQAN